MAVLDLLAGGAEMDSMSKWLLKGGHVVDPANGRSGVFDVLIDGDRRATTFARSGGSAGGPGAGVGRLLRNPLDSALVFGVIGGPFAANPCRVPWRPSVSAPEE
jgi:hypothetical protein